jgi:uncharacterized YigZ family protein
MRIKEECRNETNIQKSKFIACAAPCADEKACRAYIEQIRQEFPDASHVCTAYICGINNEIQHSNDNKEPSGTAGMPMLEALKHSGLSNICVCTVRYFGGIKLGPGGLIRAYAGSVKDVLDKAKKVEDIPLHQYSLTYPYDLSGILEGWLRRNTDIIDIQYSDQVTVLFETADDTVPNIIQDLSRGSVSVNDRGIIYREKDINS